MKITCICTPEKVCAPCPCDRGEIQINSDSEQYRCDTIVPHSGNLDMNLNPLSADFTAALTAGQCLPVPYPCH